ncbi:MAG: response regulator transcription factor [Bacteroidota bacterium]|nr:response regulator transcription factor [Bacteroidota bacterium]
MKILIIEDEQALLQSILAFLTASGYVCESVSDYAGALEKLEVYNYDCIVLDIMLPGGSGLQLLKYMKENKSQDGVIILSAKDSLEDKIKGLELGADDYLTKPFHLAELSVRIASIIRRKKFSGQVVLQFGEFQIDTAGQSISVSSKILDLTQKEYQLLLFLCINKNKVITKNAIAEHLWGDDMDMASNLDFIYVHIKNLRKKIVAAGAEDPIKSLYGVGYKLEIP